MQEVKKRKKRKKKISKIMTLLLLLVILVFFVSILYLNVIPLVWTIVVFIVALFITYGITLLNFSRKKGFRLIGYFFSIVIITIIIYISTYLFNTIGFLFNVTNGDYTLKNYNVLVIDDKFKRKYRKR